MYSEINLGDVNATARMREESKERLLSYIKDAEAASTYASGFSKEELTRASLSVDFLSRELS